VSVNVKVKVMGGSDTRFISEGNKTITLLDNFQSLPLIYRSTESILISNSFPGYRTHLSVSGCTRMSMLFQSLSQFVVGIYNHALNASDYTALKGRIPSYEVEDVWKELPWPKVMYHIAGVNKFSRNLRATRKF